MLHLELLISFVTESLRAGADCELEQKVGQFQQERILGDIIRLHLYLVGLDEFVDVFPELANCWAVYFPGTGSVRVTGFPLLHEVAADFELRNPATLHTCVREMISRYLKRW